MRIGILTFHYGSNYGGVLQCFALQELLKNKGHDVCVINYIPKDSFKRNAQVVLYLLKKHNASIFRLAAHYILHHQKSRKVFRVFREKYLNLSEEHSDINQFKDLSLDVIIVGSDQIWNFTQQRSTVYFLGWLNNHKIRKVSYSACCGSNHINEKYRSELISQLNQFNALSVRTTETKEFIWNLLKREVPIVLDPTMLYDFKEFLKPNSEKYILAYILNDEIIGGNDKAINLIKNKYNDMPVYSLIISDRIPRLCNWADKQLYDLSPDQWVNMIYNCSFMITDSYHGTLFSMKYQKPFISYSSNKNKGKRLKDIKDTFHFKNIVSSVKEVDDVLKNNEEIVSMESKLLEEYKSRSLEFIDSNICCY